MGLKEIQDRLKKLEARRESPEMVTLVYLIDGEEKRRSMGIHEATRQVMEQSTAALFGDIPNDRIIGVECMESDGFLEALIDTEVIEDIDDIVEV